MLPSTNIRTDIVIVKDLENPSKYLKIPLTKQQYENLVKIKGDWNPTELIEIRDVDSNEKLWHGMVRDIHGFSEIKHKDTSNMNWICDYGTKHQLGSECTCKSIYKCYPSEFLKKMHELYARKREVEYETESGKKTKTIYDAFYPGDLTKEQKLTIAREIQKSK